MKQTILTLAILGFSALPSIAADDFGTPFTNQAPAGFSDIAPADDQFDIQNFDPNTIEPAAGSEEPAGPDAQLEAQDMPSDEAREPSDEISL